MKINLVNPWIIGLQEIIKNKKKKEINTSRTYSMRGMHTTRVE